MPLIQNICLLQLRQLLIKKFENYLHKYHILENQSNEELKGQLQVKVHQNVQNKNIFAFGDLEAEKLKWANGACITG